MDQQVSWRGANDLGLQDIFFLLVLVGERVNHAVCIDICIYISHNLGML